MFGIYCLINALGSGFMLLGALALAHQEKGMSKLDMGLTLIFFWYFASSLYFLSYPPIATT